MSTTMVLRSSRPDADADARSRTSTVDLTSSLDQVDALQATLKHKYAAISKTASGVFIAIFLIPSHIFGRVVGKSFANARRIAKDAGADRIDKAYAPASSFQRYPHNCDCDCLHIEATTVPAVQASLHLLRTCVARAIATPFRAHAPKLPPKPRLPRVVQLDTGAPDGQHWSMVSGGASPPPHHAALASGSAPGRVGKAQVTGGRVDGGVFKGLEVEPTWAMDGRPTAELERRRRRVAKLLRQAEALAGQMAAGVRLGRDQEAKAGRRGALMRELELVDGELGRGM